MNRSELVEIFQRTMHACKTEPALICTIGASVKAQRVIFAEEEVPVPEPKRSEPCALILSKDRTLAAAKKYANGKRKVAVLNFASFVTPGGGVTWGARAQEESLCRVSTLYPCLTDDSAASFYSEHKRKIDECLVDRMNNDDCIFTPGVCVLREDTFDGPFLQDRERYAVDVITCAAPDLREPQQLFTVPDEAEFRAQMAKRIRRVLAIAAANGADVLILGAFGCGAFMNPPKVVAKAFEDALAPFRKHFETIEFAVYAPVEDSDNYRAFAEIGGIRKWEELPTPADTASLAERLSALEDKLCAYRHAMGVLMQDGETVAPEGSAEGRGHTMGVLSGMEYALIADPATLQLANDILAVAPQNETVLRRKAELLKKEAEQISRIPENEYTAYVTLTNNASAVWKKAKTTNDYALFASYLEQIVAFNRKFAGYYAPDKAPYDALLNEYEEGMDTATLDAFFAELRATLVPLIRKVARCPQPDDAFLRKSYPIEKQRAFSDAVMELMGIDRNFCTIGETEHPFTNNFTNRDVRITTHYYEHAPESSMFSVIHEGGHAIYELDIDDAYNHTLLSGGVSMAVHESQSRFYENIIGRSRAFTQVLFEKFAGIFPEQTAGVTAEDFYRAVNRVEPSLIRVEADEVTYALHVMVRYEIEKQLIAGTLQVKDVPARWNALYKEYLGVDVPDDAHGCLQDTHWSGGSIGYFPSYALGSAYGAQMLAVMERDLGDVYEKVGKGDLSDVRAWLTEHIHKYGCLKKPGELFEQACGKFDPKYYTEYLKRKVADVYGIETE
ncbi:MAG: TIGR02452 family protein [Clostridia bacterium]|nr:TIGR02452 family protein [Clostridia bacterium]